MRTETELERHLKGGTARRTIHTHTHTHTVIEKESQTKTCVGVLQIDGQTHAIRHRQTRANSEKDTI